MSRYNEIQISHKENLKNRLKRQLKIGTSKNYLSRF